MLRARHRAAMPPGPQGQTQVALPGHLIPSLLLSAGRPILPEMPAQLWGMVPMLQRDHCSQSGTCLLLRQLGCDGGRVPPDPGPLAQDMLNLHRGLKFLRSLRT